AARGAASDSPSSGLRSVTSCRQFAAGGQRIPDERALGSERMSPSALIVVASLLFATMGVCVRLASADYGAGEIVMYRGLVGALMIGLTCRWRGESLRTRLPAQHALRSTTGVVALCLWFYAIAHLPLATAITLNYTSSLWLAVFVL